MANPRDTVAFDNIDAEFVTVKIDGVTITFDQTKSGGSAQVGLAVTGSADKTVALCADGEPVMGKLTKVEPGGFGVVQYEGGMTLPGGNGAALTVMQKIVGALGPANAKGYIRAVAAAAAGYVQGTMQDALNGRGLIVDASTTTAVAVIL